MVLTNIMIPLSVNVVGLFGCCVHDALGFPLGPSICRVVDWSLEPPVCNTVTWSFDSSVCYAVDWCLDTPVCIAVTDLFISLFLLTLPPALFVPLSANDVDQTLDLFVCQRCWLTRFLCLQCYWLTLLAPLCNAVGWCLDPSVCQSPGGIWPTIEISLEFKSAILNIYIPPLSLWHKGGGVSGNKHPSPPFKRIASSFPMIFIL
jgi:hypothetical protein